MSVLFCTRCRSAIDSSDNGTCPQCGLKQSELVMEPRRPGFIRLRGARGREWEQATGLAIFPVTHVVPEPVSIFDQEVGAFMLDMGRIDRDHVRRIAVYLATKFSRPFAVVKTEIESMGIPIIAEDYEVLRG